VGIAVQAEDLWFEVLVVIEGAGGSAGHYAHVDVMGCRHDMRVGNDITVAIHDDARASALLIRHETDVAGVGVEGRSGAHADPNHGWAGRLSEVLDRGAQVRERRCRRAAGWDLAMGRRQGC
jgi:hypothetical protein